jgi:hypothetical protein
MSAAVTCDHCDTVLLVNKQGDDENGERAAWLVIEAGGLSWDACTRACAIELINGPMVEVVEEHQAIIAEVARLIKERREEADDDEADE